MSYKNINKKRLTFLITYGIEKEALYDFLEKHRKALIACGMKLDNIPKEFSTKVNMVASIPSSANHLFQSWLEVTLGEHELSYSPEDLVHKFEELENTELGTDNLEQVTEMSKCSLQYLIQEKCPDILLDFLKTSIRDEDKEISPETSSHNSHNDYSEEELKILANTVLNDTVINEDHRFSEISKFLRTIIALKTRNIGEAEKISETLRKDLPYRDVALEMINKIPVIKKPVRLGIECFSKIAEFDDKELEPEALNVFGYCANIIPDKFGHNVHFIQPVGIIDDKKLIVLNEKLLCTLFPDTGRLIAFSNKSHFRLPSQGEFGLWRVTALETSKEIKYTLHDVITEVYIVRHIRCNSTHYEGVRNWFKNYTHEPNPALFWLEDNLLIKPHKKPMDFDKMSFEEPFDAWSWLPGIQWKDEIFVVEPLPPPESRYDCSDISSLIKKVLKIDSQLEHFPKLTSSQIKEFSSFLGSDQKKVLPWQLDRIKSELNSYVDICQETPEIIGMILNKPEIKKVIESEKQKAVQAIIEEQNKLNTTINNLISEKAKIEKQIEEKSAEVKQMTSKVGKSIIKAFDEAKAKGEKILGEVALFECLIKSPNTERTNHQEHSLSQISQKYKMVKYKTSGSSLLDAILGTGISKVTARILNNYIPLVTKNGFIPVFKGRVALLLAEEIAKAMTKRKALVINIPVGLTSNCDIVDIMTSDPEIDTILINNGNLSPIESYAPELFSIAAKRIINPDAIAENILITFSNNSYAFQIPTDFIWNCAIINIDDNIKTDIDDFEILEAANEFLESIGTVNTQWLKALSRIEQEMNTLDINDRLDIKAAIKATILDEYGKQGLFRN